MPKWSIRSNTLKSRVITLDGDRGSVELYLYQSPYVSTRDAAKMPVPDFIPSVKFAGKRSGYEYKHSGKSGAGYYLVDAALAMLMVEKATTSYPPSCRRPRHAVCAR